MINGGRQQPHCGGERTLLSWLCQLTPLSWEFHQMLLLIEWFQQIRTSPRGDTCTLFCVPLSGKDIVHLVTQDTHCTLLPRRLERPPPSPCLGPRPRLADGTAVPLTSLLLSLLPPSVHPPGCLQSDSAAPSLFMLPPILWIFPTSSQQFSGSTIFSRIKSLHCE